jgi:DNA primase
MARIPEEEIERVKREVSVSALVRESGVELGRHGANGDLAGRCPYHSPDETPSLIVSEAAGLFHCLGCGAAGSVFDWVMRREGVSFREAAERYLAELGGEQLPGEELARRVKGNADEAALLEQVVELYHARATLRPEAAAYLHGRGIERAEEMIRRFRLGQADRTLGYGLTRELRERLQGVGVIRPSGHEMFSGSLVVPIYDEAGRVGEVYGRKMGTNLRKGTPLHLYLPGPHRGVWNTEALRGAAEAHVCEGFTDALTLVDRRFEATTWVYGVEGLTADHIETLRRSGTERVVLWYDGDAAGDRGVERHAERLMASLGVECFRAPIPRGQDVNSFAREVADPAGALAELVRRAEWLGRGARLAVNAPAPEPDSAREQEPASERERAAPLAAALAAEHSGAVARIDAADGGEATTGSTAPGGAGAAPASAVAPVPALEIAMEVEGEDVWFDFGEGERRYRVRGLDKKGTPGQMRVQVLALRGVELHADTLDLAAHRARKEFAREAAAELGAKEEAVKRDLGRVLFKLELLVDERRRAAEEARAREPAMTDAEREEAMGFLRDPRLLARVLEDFARCGVVGEETNKLVGYLAAVSRKLEDPLAVIIQSSSAAGKTSLMDAILAFVPEEERVKYSAVTGQSLFYMAETDLRHKVLALVEEEGAERASYALKLLQSEGELTIASTGKDPQTGRLVTHEYRVEGPVALILTTTAVEIEEELRNRAIVLTVDEEREQTRAIHRQQRERRTLEGLLARRQREDVVRVHRNAQRLLRAVAIVNPFAPRLTFLDSKTRMRRDHEKYLTLIEAIALVHQYQREVKSVRDRGQLVPYIEVTREDIRMANRLAHEVLGRSLDELSPQTRRLLSNLHEMVTRACEREGLRREQYRFSRRDVREAVGWSYEQVRVHLERLVELEYVIAHKGGRGQQFVYELLYEGEGEDGRAFLMGLIAIEALEAGRTTEAVGACEAGLGSAGGGFGEGVGCHTGLIPGRSGNGEPGRSPRQYGPEDASGAQGPKNASREGAAPASSYVLERRSPEPDGEEAAPDGEEEA